MPNISKRIYFSSFLSSPPSLISCLALTAMGASGCSSDITRFSSNSLNLADNSLSSSSNYSAHVKGPYSLGHNSAEPRYYSASESFDNPITRVDLPPPDLGQQSGPSSEIQRTSSLENSISTPDMSATFGRSSENGKDTLYNLSLRSGVTEEEFIRQNSLKGFTFRPSETSKEPSQKLASLTPRQGYSTVDVRSSSETVFKISPQNPSVNTSGSAMSESNSTAGKIQSSGSSINTVKTEKYVHTPLPLLPSEKPSAPEKEAKVVVADLKQNTEGQKTVLSPSNSPTLLNSQNLNNGENLRKEPPQESVNQVQAAKETSASVTEIVRLRWPVKGRITSPFGLRTDGTKNDGIDISVPLGTEIHAAEDGVVAYAGDQLPSYGNLVLIRHEKGVVTAYAHTDQIKVKRGDRVSRGQVIATAGKTGAVDQPKLHFEVREGPKAVDPLMHLEKI